MAERHRRLVWAAVALATLGLAVALYLTWIYLRGGPTAPGALFCGPGSGCAAAWSSPYARMAGLPLSALGALAYLALAGLGMWTVRIMTASRSVRDRRRRARFPWQLAAAAGVAWAGMVFSLYLEGVQALVLRTLCPWCTLSAAIMTAVAVLYSLALPASLLRAPVAAGLVGGVVLAVLNYVPAAGVTGPGGTVPRVSATGSAPVQVASLEQLNRLLTAGDPGAPVLVEVYSDFQCPYCARAAAEVVAPLLREDVAQGRMRVGFRNFAFLGEESQRAAEAAACAAVQGRFWEYHDRLFAAAMGENVGSFTFSRLLRLAQESGLDVGSFESCLASRRMQRLIDESRQEARSRGVRATPTFFVNGRKVEGLVPLAEIRRLAYSP